MSETIDLPPEVLERIHALVPARAFVPAVENNDTYPAPPLPEGDGTGESLYPFKLIPKSGGKLLIIYGTVNSGAPSGMVAGTDYVISIPGTDTFVYLAIGMSLDVDVGLWSAGLVTIGFGGSLPDSSDTQMFVLIGVVLPPAGGGRVKAFPSITSSIYVHRAGYNGAYLDSAWGVGS